MGKLLQICASANDLFGLDGDGVVYQYNFNTNSWMGLGRGRSHDGGGGLAERQPGSLGTVAFCECGRPLPAQVAPPPSAA